MTRKFKVNDYVRFIGKEDIFEVVGYHQSVYFTQGKFIEYNRYFLRNDKTKELGKDYVSEDSLEYVKTIRITKEAFDLILDEYNDYTSLYDEFGNEEYKAMIDKLMRTMKLSKVE